MEKAARSMLEAMSDDERALYSLTKLREVRADFDRLSQRWSQLNVGESFTEAWLATPGRG